MAVTDEVGVYNLALNAIGERSNISLPTESSRQAEVCNLWYESVRNQILAAAPWPEAMGLVYLALQDTQDDATWTEEEPRRGYNYVYALPEDCLRPRYLDNFGKFLLTERANVRLLHTNHDQAVLAYTKRLSNIALWSPDLLMAVAYGLAAHICTPLSGKPTRSRVLAEKANEIMLNARANAANSQTEMHEALPDWIKARGYQDPQTTQYFYPMGSLLSISGVN